MNSLYGWALRFEAVRGALSSQSTDQPGIRVEACDRLGQMARIGRGQGYSDA